MKKDKTNYSDCIEFYANMTLHDKAFFLRLMQKDIVIPVVVKYKRKGEKIPVTECHHMTMCPEMETNVNGTKVDIWLEGDINLIPKKK